jgi:ubiquinone biosynthesis protein COQ9
MKRTEKIEILIALATKRGMRDCTEQDLMDGIEVLAEDWDTVLAIADEVEIDEVWDTETAIVDGIYVTYDPYEDWGAEEI